MKLPITILLLISLSCNKQTDKPVVTITPTLTVENNKWVIHLKYSPEINTIGVIRFNWTVKNSEGKSFSWFGASPLSNPVTEQKYLSEIAAFEPFVIQSLEILPDDYLNKYIILIK